MRIAGGVLGLVGAVIALILGGIGFASVGFLQSVAEGAGQGLEELAADINTAAAEGGLEGIEVGDVWTPMVGWTLYKYLLILLPIIGIIGGAISFKNAKPGAIMLVVAGVLGFLTLGLGGMTIICYGLMIVGAVLVFLDSNNQQPAAA